VDVESVATRSLGAAVTYLCETFTPAELNELIYGHTLVVSTAK